MRLYMYIYHYTCQVGVHIADVTHFVHAGSAMDAEVSNCNHLNILTLEVSQTALQCACFSAITVTAAKAYSC
jgi:hypothetical protein